MVELIKSFKKTISPEVMRAGLLILFLSVPLVMFIAGSQSLAVYLLCVLAAAYFISRSAESGVYAIVFLTVIFGRYFCLYPLEISNVVYKIYLLDIVIGLTFISACWAHAFGGHKLRWRFGQMEIAIILFILLCFVFWIRGFSLADISHSVAFSSFKNYAFYTIIFFLFTWIIQTKKQFVRFMNFFGAAGVVLLLFVLGGILNHQGFDVEFNPLSTQGVRYLSFPHAYYLSMAVLALIPFWIYSRRQVVVRTLLIWGQLLGVVVSLMRHLWLSLAGAGMLVIVLMGSNMRGRLALFLRRNIALVFIIISLLGVFFISFPFSTAGTWAKQTAAPLFFRIQSFSFINQDQSLNWRFHAWQAAKKTIKSHPIIGIGYGKDMVLNIDNFRQLIEIRDLHNSFLVLLVQMGLAGVLFFALINLVALKYFFKIINKKNPYFLFAVGLAGMYVNFLLASWWQPYFETNMLSIFYWFILGMLVYIYRET